MPKCDEGKKAWGYGLLCNKDTNTHRVCIHCNQSLCPYHFNNNSKGAVGGHSDCSGPRCHSNFGHMCNRKDPILPCEFCGEDYCAYHFNPVDSLADVKGGHCCPKKTQGYAAAAVGSVLATAASEVTAAIGQGTRMDGRTVAAASHATQAVKEALFGEGKFVGKKLVLGGAVEAAAGLEDAIGLDDVDELGELIRLKEAAIVHELERRIDDPDAQSMLGAVPDLAQLLATDQDRENLRYVMEGRLTSPGEGEKLPAHVRASIESGRYHGGALLPEDYDFGHDGMCLDDFVNHERAKLAKLKRVHVIALRLYTSSSYWLINGPLRTRVNPHPFRMTVYYLAQAIRKLRAASAALDPDEFVREVALWRGMKDMSMDMGDFLARGGTELAPMSTSTSQQRAFMYGESRCPLIFKYLTKGLGRGSSLQFLSLYPKEEEYLYPPLTFLQPVQNGLQRVDDEVGDGATFTILHVSPQMS